MRAFFLLFVLLIALSGCGRKGSLYLPDEPAKRATTQPSPTPDKSTRQ